MKTPINCPKCHGPLLNSEFPMRGGKNVWKKTCLTKLDHKFTCVTLQHNDNLLDVIIIGLNNDDDLKVYWNLSVKTVVVYKGPLVINGGLEIPWFEPNINEYDKLVNKVKKYVTFS